MFTSRDYSKSCNFFSPPPLKSLLGHKKFGPNFFFRRQKRDIKVKRLEGTNCRAKISLVAASQTLELECLGVTSAWEFWLLTGQSTALVPMRNV